MTRPLGTGSSWRFLRQSGGRSSRENSGHRSGRVCPDACSALWATCPERDCSSCSWLLQGPGSRPQGKADHLGTVFQPPVLPLRPPSSPGSTWSTFEKARISSLTSSPLSSGPGRAPLPLPAAAGTTHHHHHHHHLLTGVEWGWGMKPVREPSGPCLEGRGCSFRGCWTVKGKLSF